MRDMRPVAFELEPDGDGGGGKDRFRVFSDPGEDAPAHVPLDTLEDYLEAVGTRQNAYHPNEVAADLLPRIVLGLPADGPNGGAKLKAVRAWATETFGNRRE